ncbi:hypothetical protein BZG02_16635 [Labilibaculum filiforme]|uniref:DUF1579 domain-containing protein n=1 Tax=Labilibaculum filiforme TaxID=1940526 RepID=A0A2N3HT82_9BACT|nr:hypothetical protein [Labilibaculum filiforme]PKQ61259.1 hypothetical protein BZG02_16635 [Labilibaculum filiforme]
MKRFLLLIFILFSTVSFSQNPITNTTSPNRLFDFWLGDWDVFTNDDLVAHNTVILLQNGNLLQENWVSEKENFTGTSYSFYNSKIDKWQQIWVDKNGNNLLLKGNFENGKMLLSSSSDSNMGEDQSLHRISWVLMPNGNVKQVWESSIDEGKIWNIQFEGIYKKKE